MLKRIAKPRFAGFFRPEDVEGRALRLAIGQADMLRLYWLVDVEDGIIADARFQAFGPPELILAGEIASELVLRKNYDQASRLTTELLDRHVREHKETPAFSKEAWVYLTQAISAIERAAYQCLDIPFALQHETTPIAHDEGALPDGIPGWGLLPLEDRRRIVEEVVDKEIRPYIELDAGGVTIQELRESGEVLIAYSGSCTSCHSSTGSTLSAIQQILQSRVHPGLVVIPIL